MEEKKEKVRCSMCNRERDLDHIPDSGCGTCVYCLAELGHPDAIKLVEEECRENGGYRGIDSVVVSGLAIDKPECESTTEECDKCSRLVWVSTGTRADAEKSAEEEGGSVVYLCMSCVPEAIMAAELHIGGRQKDELQLAGVDVEQFIMKDSGFTLEQIARMVALGRARDKKNQKKREGT